MADMISKIDFSTDPDDLKQEDESSKVQIENARKFYQKIQEGVRYLTFFLQNTNKD